MQTEDQLLTELAAKYRHHLKLLNLQGLAPPYFPKSLTKFRLEAYAQTKKHFDLRHEKQRQADLSYSNKILQQFIHLFDEDVLEIYLNQLRGPYIKKMLEENYQFDKLDMKHLNTDLMLRTEIEQLTGFACQWLLQVELSYDLIERAKLYFNVDLDAKYESLKEKLMKQEKWTIGGYSLGLMKKSLVFLLKKAASLLDSYGKSQIQTLFPTILLVVYSVAGGGLPWALRLPKMNIGIIIGALLGPMVLNSVSDKIEKDQAIGIMNKLSEAMASTAENLAHFNQLLTSAIKDCSLCHDWLDFDKKLTLLTKYLEELDAKQTPALNYDEHKFDKMKQLIDSQFQQYYQVQYKHTGWQMLLTEEDYREYEQNVLSLQRAIYLMDDEPTQEFDKL